MTTPTLTEFLLARIAEDEAMTDHLRRDSADPWGWQPLGHQLDVCTKGRVDYPPARVLAECEAKRRIVAEAEEVSRHERKMASMASVSYDTPTSGEAILYLLALPYADHPDYDESWRPLTP